MSGLGKKWTFKSKDKMMKTTIIAFGAAVLVVMGAYWAGTRIGSEKCHAETMQKSNLNTIAIQNEITKAKERVNAETFNTGVRDIRGRLRENWTIRG